MVQSEHRTVGLVEESWDAAGLAAFARLLRQGLMRAVWPGLWVSLGLMLFVPTSCFLLLAFSPAAFAQGSAWLSIDSFRQALQGPTLRGLLDSLFAGAVTSVLALLVGCWLAWIIQRSTLWGKPLWGIAIWALLLTPSYLSALGWESLFESRGLLAQIGVDPGGAHDLLFGPVGIIWVLATRGVPFSYLAVAAGLQGVGREFEDAARVHGGSRVEALQVTFAILLPAMWSAIAIVFAESISDFGVASTLAAGAHFPVATYTLYLAIDSMPIRFPVASAVGWFLVASSALALLAQYGALRGRSFAALGGRTRGASTHRFGTVGQVAAQVSLILFFGLALGVPAIGAITASILKDFGAHFSVANVTLDNYTRALGSPSLLQPMILSGKMAAVTATLAVIFGAFVGQVLSRRRVGVSGRALDMFLMGAVALPSTVLAAGYIFAYNLPVLSALGISLYGTVFLLGVAYL
ncbi:MAG TPA: hypothetical protein VKX96_01035, partial [Chloroflexota bacterium]|nr:hypothetical protein [Chloroflexota bacterium]